MLYLTKSTRVTLVLFKLPRQRSRDLWRIFSPRQLISIFPSLTLKVSFAYVNVRDIYVIP